MTEVTVALRTVNNLLAATAQQTGRNPADICLIAVSKTKPVSQIVEAMAAGQNDFAENYLQEALVKIQTLADSTAVWHFIGRIQGNKTAAIAAAFDWVQTVDRERIATRLDHQRPASLPPLNVCIQVKLDADPDRPGAAEAEVRELADLIEKLPRLRLRGLMAMPPLTADPQDSRPHFDHMRSLYESLRSAGYPLDTLSMGTTADMPQAIAAGATMIRVGSAIFGSRTPK